MEIWDKIVKAAAAGVGAVLSWWAGLGVMPQTLAVFMLADYATGLMCAWRGVSPKTQSGTVSSKAGFDGLLKKACIVLVVLIAAAAGGVMPALMALSAGAMMLVVMAEMIPEASGGRDGVLACVLGYAIMMALDIALG